MRKVIIEVSCDEKDAQQLENLSFVQHMAVVWKNKKWFKAQLIITEIKDDSPKHIPSACNDM